MAGSKRAPAVSYLPIMVLIHQGGEGAWAFPYLALPLNLPHFRGNG
jgi:hypothetical protein